MSTAHTPTPQQRFLSLLKHHILKLELAELDFGIYRILNYRRAQVLALAPRRARRPCCEHAARHVSPASQ